MKKRILASLLTLCMVFAMIPTIAPMASAAGGDLKINGGVITPNTDVAYGGGTANYDKASSTLTLTNATIELASWAQYGISAEFPLNIHLVGDNQITGSIKSKAIFIGDGWGSGQSLNITAEAGGSLAINSNGGISCSDLIINSSVTLTINASNTPGIQCVKNYTQIAGSNVSVTS
ncbi:MAG: hypothetical protein RSC43_09130, partial [Clostridia bacterium]